MEYNKDKKIIYHFKGTHSGCLDRASAINTELSRKGRYLGNTFWCSVMWYYLIKYVAVSQVNVVASKLQVSVIKKRRRSNKLYMINIEYTSLLYFT